MRKRTEKHRASRTHGRGKKAGRGAGKRGGRGNAGLHKHNQMRMWKYFPDHFGRKGFKRDPSLTWEKSVTNVGDVQSNLTAYIQSGVAERTGKQIIIDLTKTDVVKLLGSGDIKSPLTIKVYEATEKAKAKVEAAGGKVELPFEPADDGFDDTEEFTEEPAEEAPKAAPKEVPDKKGEAAPKEAPEKETPKKGKPEKAPKPNEDKPADK